MAARQDAVRLGRQHVQGSFISFRRSKTTIPVDIPMLPELQVAIDAMPQDQLTFLTKESGQPLSASAFSYWFELRCKEAGIPKGFTAHGLRKAGATRLAEHGCTDHEIMAWGGWKTLKEVQRYTREANRKRLALQGAHKLKGGTSLANLETRLANQT